MTNKKPPARKPAFVLERQVAENELKMMLDEWRHKHNLTMAKELLLLHKYIWLPLELVVTREDIMDRESIKYDPEQLAEDPNFRSKIDRIRKTRKKKSNNKPQ